MLNCLNGLVASVGICGSNVCDGKHAVHSLHLDIINSIAFVMPGVDSGVLDKEVGQHFRSCCFWDYKSAMERQKYSLDGQRVPLDCIIDVRDVICVGF